MWPCRSGNGPNQSRVLEAKRRRHSTFGCKAMALDLSKNGVALLAAYKDVVDVKKNTNWCLFTYEGNSNVIRVSGTGAGGLEELHEELNSGKVMFAFCQVQDPNSGLPKYVLINWTGEGVKDSRKGMCANHLSSIASFLKGAHVTINARDEQDVDPELILSKVSKASGANFSFQQRDEAFRDTPREPVGSVYEKTNAVDEIQRTNKDHFWAQTQRDEELRRHEEKKRTQEEKLKIEKERRELEEKQMKELERRTEERAAQIEEERRVLKQREEEERKGEEEDQQEIQKERTSRVWKQEAKEAKALIGQRPFNPRDVFEQKSQQQRTSAPASSPGKLRSPFLSQVNGMMSPAVTPQPIVSPTVSPVEPLDNLYTAEEQQEEDHEWSDEFDDDEASSEAPAPDSLVDTLPQPIRGSHGHDGDGGVCARAMYDYQAADDTEITFDPGDIITHIDMLDEGWWRGYGPDGHYGMFPANYVELL